MLNQKATCDACAKDLSATDNAEGWRLCLLAEPLPHRTNRVTLLHVPAPVARDHHFCGLGCLEVWLCERRKPPAG